MSGRDQIESIKEVLDIASVIGAYVPTLKRTGRNYFGLCPFHKEKTPSFSVNPELRLFKCFGCGEGGDVIKFFERIEGLDFPKALELAASKAGITLEKSYSTYDNKYDQEKKRLLAANVLTAKYYNYLLLKHPLGEPGLKYAKKRKLEEKEITKFLIGYAPKGFENLKGFLIKRGYSPTELVNWGLLVNRDGKIYDKFRNRLMFTIFDHQGDVVGFSGRLIDPEALGPKYLNSSETLVYKKSKLLYGLYQAKDAIRKNKFTVLVEGNVDILSSHRIGIENIVAPLGTALTIEQVRLLKRYCDSIYFALDTDEAGQHALEKDLVLLDNASIKAYVLELGEYKDVDELIVKGGDWKGVIANPEEVVPYFIKSLLKRYDLSKSFMKSEYTRKILGFIQTVDDKILQNDYLQKLQDTVGVDVKILKNELDKLKELNTNKDEKSEIGQGTRIKERQSLSKYLLALISEHRQFKNEIKKELGGETWVDDEFKMVFRAIWDQNLTKDFMLSTQELFEEISMMPVPVFDDEEKFIKEMQYLLQRIKKEAILEELDILRLKKDGEDMKRLQELTKQLSRLNLVQ
jgi:DNA primase